MATFVNDTRIAHLSTYPSALEYVTLTGNVGRSGNTVTLSSLVVTVRVSTAYSAYGEAQNYYIANSASGGALTQTGSFTFNFADGPNHTESHGMANMSFSVETTTTSKTLYLRASNNEDAQIPFTVTFPSGVVAPNKPTISINGTTEDTVTIVYGTTSFGTPSTGTVTLYGGTSPNPTTVIATSNTTGNHTFTHTGLTTGTTYYYRARANNGQASSSYSIEVSAIPSTAKPIVLYGSVSNLAKRITTLYGGVDSAGYTVISLSNNPNFDSTTFMNKYKSQYGEMTVKPLQLNLNSVGVNSVAVLFSDFSAVELFQYSEPYTDQGSSWGFIEEPKPGVFTSTEPASNTAKKITKLYGSVNGEARLIHQGFGHLTYT